MVTMGIFDECKVVVMIIFSHVISQHKVGKVQVRETRRTEETINAVETARSPEMSRIVKVEN
jgi:hypothetical protein